MAKTAYINGTILSMLEDAPVYTLLVEENGIISEIGNAEYFDSASFDGVVVDLSGKTVMPGFMEAHGHSMQYAEYRLYVDITEDAGVTSIEDMQKVLKDYLQDHSVPEGRFLIGNGYDNAFFQADGILINSIWMRCLQMCRLLFCIFPDTLAAQIQKRWHY